MTQEDALRIMKTGANVLLTGEPGSGKTHTINEYVRYLRQHGVNPAITASTGIAATHISGMTIHSWSGIGIRKTITDYELDELTSRDKLYDRINQTSVLIIDEISMLDAATLDLVELVCRTIRRSDHPWGGMQVILVGDFFQLPPVSRAGEALAQFAFRSRAWEASKVMICYLSEQHRQVDGVFLGILSSIRRNQVDEELIEQLNERTVARENLAVHTQLYSHNLDVDRINDSKLAALPGQEYQFRMDGKGNKHLIETLQRGCLSPELLRLKVGAKVMFTKNNYERGFANGTLGEVTGFDDLHAPIVKTYSGDIIHVPIVDWTITDGSRILARILQYPLRLAWAITIHKSQGMTLDAAVVDLSHTFEYGQGYVALSRLRSFDGLSLLGLNSMALRVHPEIVDIDESFRARSIEIENFFSNVTEEEMKTMHENFLIAAGGQLEEVEIVPTEKIKRPRKKGVDTYAETLRLYRDGQNVDAIAATRDLSASTIMSHLEELYMRGDVKAEELKGLLSDEILQVFSEIESALKESEGLRLTPVFEKFGGKYSYDQLRLVRLLMN